MCILLKLHYAKFDVSGLFCSKVIEEKPLGDWLDLTVLQKGCRLFVQDQTILFFCPGNTLSFMFRMPFEWNKYNI